MKRRNSTVRSRAVTLVVGLAALSVAAASGATAPKAATPAALPNVLRNGTFAIPKPFEAANVEAGGSYQIAGWQEGAPGVQDFYKTFIQTPGSLTQAVKLYLSGPSSISQTVATVPGTTYQLQWYGAAEPGGPAVQNVHVLWNGGTVASPAFKTGTSTQNDVNWSLEKTIVTATSTSSTLEFLDTTPANGTTTGPLVAGVDLAGYARLYLPSTVRVTPTGTLLAVVRNGTNTTLTVGGLSIKLYATKKTVSYAPAVTELVASAPVTQGQAKLRLHLAASVKGQTLAAYAVLQGPDYIPVTVKLTLKVA
jgi:Protein of unknown function (DUF642)